MGGAERLLGAVRRTGAGAFLSDTAPIIYRLERAARRSLVDACDPLFDAVARAELGCIVSAISVAELMIGPFRAGPAALSVVDGFLRQPMVGIAAADDTVAWHAAELVARNRVGRLADALIAATAIGLGLPLITGDRGLARADVADVFLVADFAG